MTYCAWPLLSAGRTPISSGSYSYDYDRFGNRWAPTVTAGSGLGGTNTFNYGSNRVTTSGFTYDNSGNITANGSISSLSYNQENGLTAVGASISYAYDAQGRRARKTVSGTATDYFFSGAEVIAEKARNQSQIAGHLLAARETRDVPDGQHVRQRGDRSHPGLRQQQPRVFVLRCCLRDGLIQRLDLLVQLRPHPLQIFPPTRRPRRQPQFGQLLLSGRTPHLSLLENANGAFALIQSTLFGL